MGLAVTDLLGQWWRHPIVVERWGGTDAYGADRYDPPETVNGFVVDSTRLVADVNGQQVTSSATVLLPAATSYVPVRSLITLPAEFAPPGSTRKTEVIASARADGAGLLTPDHQRLALR